MAGLWILTPLMLLALPGYQTIALGNALETSPISPDLGLDVVLEAVIVDGQSVEPVQVHPIPAHVVRSELLPKKRYIVSRNPQDAPATEDQNPADENSDNNDSTAGTTDSVANNGTTSSTTATSTATDEQQPSSTDGSNDSDSASPSSTTSAGDNPDKSGSDDPYAERGDQPITNYEPAAAPVADDADYPNYDGQVVNSTTGGPYQTQYQYHIIANADAQGDVITLPAEYSNYSTSTMLQCMGLCNDWNNKHGSTVVCEAVAYYGDGECYPLDNLSNEPDGRYAYYAQGSILGLVLRTPTYPAPTEAKPLPDDNSSGSSYTTDTTTTTTTTTTTGTEYSNYPLPSGPVYPTTTTESTYDELTVSPEIYSRRTITPTDAYGKYTVELYVSSCPATY